MPPRKKVSDATQAEVLVQSRRRCCVCFGLHRDEGIKKGQIAHLDQDRSNNALANLVFLCFEHHDEYDSQTSQSKGLLRSEVERYRDELLGHFGTWNSPAHRDALLNFLAFQVDLDAMARSAIAVGKSVVWHGEELAFDVLITDSLDYCDADLYVPHIHALDHFASWGWLTHAEEERAIDSQMARMYITVKREDVCNAVAERILKLREARGESIESFLHTAESRGWKRQKGER